jgi:hypothetical protein
MTERFDAASHVMARQPQPRAMSFGAASDVCNHIASCRAVPTGLQQRRHEGMIKTGGDE